MRTFLAIELPSSIKEELSRRQSSLQRSLADLPGETCRWTRPQHFHLTLRFLGEIDESQRSDLTERLAHTLPSHSRFSLTLGEIGAFPRMGEPSVLWVGIDGDREHLDSLQRSIEAIVVQVGMKGESRPYRPHLTLARLGPRIEPESKQAIGRRLREGSLFGQEALSWRVDEVALIRSDLSPQGVRYTTLSHFSLASDP